jgi:alpha-glucuronidase
VGHYPNRIEAETMQRDGYTTVDVTPWETASGGKAVVCDRAAACTLTAKLNKPAGTYKIAVQYFDIHPGNAKYEVLLNGRSISHWTADNTLPPAVVDKKLDGHTSTRFTIPGVHLMPGDTLELRGTPDGAEPAPVDYIEITKQ